MMCRWGRLQADLYRLIYWNIFHMPTSIVALEHMWFSEVTWKVLSILITQKCFNLYSVIVPNLFIFPEWLHLSYLFNINRLDSDNSSFCFVLPRLRHNKRASVVLFVLVNDRENFFSPLFSIKTMEQWSEHESASFARFLCQWFMVESYSD